MNSHITRSIAFGVIFTLALITVHSAYAHVLTTRQWAAHAQSPSIRGDLLITNEAHFMWPYSPLDTRNLVVVVLDGKRENGMLLSESPGVRYRDPEDMAREYITDMFFSSHGHVRYEAIELIVTSNVPPRRLGPMEGSVYTNFSIDAFYDRSPDNPNRGDITVDNDRSRMDAHAITGMLHSLTMSSGMSLFDAATNGLVDEILYFGPHAAFQWETSMCGAHPLWVNGMPVMIPGSPHFVIVGCNTARTVGEMIHNNFHRWENVGPNMYADTKNVGWTYEWSYRWQGASPPYPYTELERQQRFTDTYNAWDQFTALYQSLQTNVNSVGKTLAGVGDCHYPPNVHPKKEGGYAYGAERPGYSTYRYWRQPQLPLDHTGAPDPRLGETRPVNVETWRNAVQWCTGVDEHRSFIVWAYAAIPHGPGFHRNVTAHVAPGETPAYLLNNWWCYFADHERFLEPIRALRREEKTIERFPEPEWKYSTLTFMTNVYARLGLPLTQHTVTVTTEGDGVVDGDGTFTWGSSTLLTASPAAYEWHYAGNVYSAREWLAVLVTNDIHVRVVFKPYPEVTVSQIPDSRFVVSEDSATFPLSGDQSDADAVWWKNSTTGTHGSLPTAAWTTHIPLEKGKNIIHVHTSNTWFTTHTGVEIWRGTPYYAETR